MSERKAIFVDVFFPPVDNIFHFHNLGCFYLPSVMHFHGPGSVIICPTAKSLVFLTKCMYLWLWSCRAQWYLPLSAALGGFCVALQKVCCVPETRHLTKQDGFPAGRPARLLISLCEIPERGDSIKIINKEVRISPYFWCRRSDIGRPFTEFYTLVCVCSAAETLPQLSPVALFTFAAMCLCTCMCKWNTCWWSLVDGVRKRWMLQKCLFIVLSVASDSFQSWFIHCLSRLLTYSV